MKEFLSRTWWVIIPILLVVMLISESKCTAKKEATISQAELNAALLTQKNALETKYLADNAETAKALELANKTISDGLKPQIIYKEAKAKSSVAEARKDSSTTVIANTAIDDQESLIQDMKAKAKSDSVQIAECDKQVIVKDTLLKYKDNSLQDQFRINADLQKAAKRNYIERNGIIIGSVATFSFLAALKYFLR